MACMGDDRGQMLVNILGDRNVEDQKFLSEVAQEAGLDDKAANCEVRRPVGVITGLAGQGKTIKAMV